MHWGRNGGWGLWGQGGRQGGARLPCGLIARLPAVAATGRGAWLQSKHGFCREEPFLMSQSVSTSIGILGTRVQQR